ncbi:MAG: AAA family ATPase, partial [Legionellales bacterium]
MKDDMGKSAGTSSVQRRTLFKPGSWITNIDFINHLILFNKVLITVLADKEGGKSSFCTLLHNNLDKQIKPVAMNLTPSCTTEHIISHIATQLHVEQEQDKPLDIHSIAAVINERKEHVLVIIDDAQYLNEAFIKESMVVIKNQVDSGFFHLCFVADNALVDVLNPLAVDQFNNLVHTMELGLLSESETRTYVLQRALAANLITLPLPDVYFKQFYQMTKGGLAKINTEMEAFILNCKPEKKGTNNGLLLKKTSIALSTLLVIGCAYLY